MNRGGIINAFYSALILFFLLGGVYTPSNQVKSPYDKNVVMSGTSSDQIYVLGSVYKNKLKYYIGSKNRVSVQFAKHSSTFNAIDPILRNVRENLGEDMYENIGLINEQLPEYAEVIQVEGLTPEGNEYWAWLVR